jgi:hypothetical protein
MVIYFIFIIQYKYVFRGYICLDSQNGNGVKLVTCFRSLTSDLGLIAGTIKYLSGGECGTYE